MFNVSACLVETWWPLGNFVFFSWIHVYNLYPETYWPQTYNLAPDFYG